MCSWCWLHFLISLNCFTFPTSTFCSRIKAKDTMIKKNMQCLNAKIDIKIYRYYHDIPCLPSRGVWWNIWSFVPLTSWLGLLNYPFYLLAYYLSLEWIWINTNKTLLTSLQPERDSASIGNQTSNNHNIFLIRCLIFEENKRLMAGYAVINSSMIAWGYFSGWTKWYPL